MTNLNNEFDEDTQPRAEALATFLTTQGNDTSEIEDIELSSYSPHECDFDACGSEWLVLTDEEADARSGDYIKESLWAFNASFIIEHTDLPFEAQEMLTSHQHEKCEDANETIAVMINDIDDFISDAIGADGRGHFMSSYDGHEHEQYHPSGVTYYIYRTN